MLVTSVNWSTQLTSILWNTCITLQCKPIHQRETDRQIDRLTDRNTEDGEVVPNGQSAYTGDTKPNIFFWSPVYSSQSTVG